MPLQYQPCHPNLIHPPIGENPSAPGAYFVTMVTYQRECLFGDVVDGEMKLNNSGQIVRWEWDRLPQRFAFIHLGNLIVIPNHFHGILIFHEPVGATRTDQIDSNSDNATPQSVTPVGNNGSPLPRGPKPSSPGTIIGQFKSRVTKRLWKNPDLNGVQIWQRKYYACPERSRREHIIRNDNEWNNIHLYIETAPLYGASPLNWATDEKNPTHHAS